GGVGGRWFRGLSCGKPCTWSGSSGVPRPVERGPGPPPRPPPAAPPPPPPPDCALTLKLPPESLYTARLSGTPYASGLVSSTTRVRSSDPTTRDPVPA